MLRTLNPIKSAKSSHKRTSRTISVVNRTVEDLRAYVIIDPYAFSNVYFILVQREFGISRAYRVYYGWDGVIASPRRRTQQLFVLSFGFRLVIQWITFSIPISSSMHCRASFLICICVYIDNILFYWACCWWWWWLNSVFWVLGILYSTPRDRAGNTIPVCGVCVTMSRSRLESEWTSWRIWQSKILSVSII